MAFAASVLMIFSLSTQSIAAPKGAVLIDGESGRIYFELNKDEPLPMASTTKIMTALITLEEEGLDEYFTVNSRAIKTEGSSMGLMEGDRATLRGLAVGMLLSEIDVANTKASKEPRLDYIVAKFPRFPFDKFASAQNTLGTQMKATGEVMGIGSNLEECLLKSVRSLEIGACHFHLPKFDNMSVDELFD